MHLVWIIIRFVLGPLSGGLRSAWLEQIWSPFEGPVSAAVRHPVFPNHVVQYVRPVLRRFGRVPDCHGVAPVAGEGGGVRWLVRYLRGAASPLPIAGHCRPALI
jgi:hypothetical protein